ncbi:MAG: hypothetical protein KAT04_01750 [Methylococcales bacterium]|nr:hypothetical protein [Methylococcales bacterium]
MASAEIKGALLKIAVEAIKRSHVEHPAFFERLTLHQTQESTRQQLAHDW